MSADMVGNLMMVAAALGAVYTLMALGLTLVYGVTKVFNFAQGSFYLWGGYIAWAFHEGYFHLNYPLAFAISIGIMFGFGLVYERAIIYPLRRFADWGWTAIIVTLGSALLLDNLALVIFGSRGKTLPHIVEGVFTYGSFTVARHDIAMLFIAIAIMIILALFLGKARAGMAMRGVAQDAVGANIVGIPIDRVFSYTFAITAVFAGIAGMLLAPRTQLYPFVGWPVFCKALVVLVFGGLGSTKGTLIAAFTLAIVEVFVTYYIGAVWSLTVFLVVLMVLLVFRPRGLFGAW
jgi:branched-chain amino acid transport system permease protein